MFIRPQNIQGLNNPVHLAILLILVQTINKNFTHPFPSVNPPTYCISFNLVIEKLMIPTPLHLPQPMQIKPFQSRNRETYDSNGCIHHAQTG